MEEADYQAQCQAEAEAEGEAMAQMSAEAENEANIKNEEMGAQDEFNQEIDNITDELYCAYGSGTGVLFGIPSNLKSSVRAIVKVIWQMKQKNAETLNKKNYEKLRDLLWKYKN